MRTTTTIIIGLLVAFAGSFCATAWADEHNVPPPGFTALFNGKDLDGWRGLGHVNPYEIAKWSSEERTAKQQAADADMRAHWRAEGGEIINDGSGVYLTTAKDYRDFELLLEWRMMSPNTDSGIYLRGCPQVQIWDPANPRDQQNGCDKGSGALWNNQNEAEGKWPLFKADKPIGQWNSFRILMLGERVTVEFNGQTVVRYAVMENFWDRARPMLPAGPIQLQTHGGEMRFRNVFVREIAADEANRMLTTYSQEGFKTLFNGKDLEGWIGATDSYEAVDGLLRFKQGGGTLFTADPYSDFAIRFEFRLPPGGNNGLAIRSPLKGNPAFAGMELQILDDGHPKYENLKDWQVHGSVYGVAGAHRGYLRPTGEWNYQEVIAKGPHIQVALNGTKILDVDLGKVEKAPDGNDHPGRHRTEGHIGFMGHGDPVEFRNIRIKGL